MMSSLLGYLVIYLCICPTNLFDVINSNREQTLITYARIFEGFFVVFIFHYKINVFLGTDDWFIVNFVDIE